MKTPTEKLLENIEESFIKLNTSVELINKAENITTNSLQTSTTLINEFKNTTEDIGKLIKEDFNHEYKLVHELNVNLIKKINDFDFQNIKSQVTDLRNYIESNRLSDKASIDTTESHVIANNQFLDKFQNHTFPDLSTSISELQLELNENFLRNANHIDLIINKIHVLENQIIKNHKKNRIQFYIILFFAISIFIIIFYKYTIN